MIDHDAGGRIRLIVPDHVISEAIYSPCRWYRYLLQRRWGLEVDRSLMFIMLNPSTATEEFDDPTVRKCRTWAVRWGYNHLIIGNIMGYRATDPILLRDIDDPIGPENYSHLREAIERYTPKIICAWGRLPSRLAYVEQMAIDLLCDLDVSLHVLRRNVSGGPWHPLYLPLDIQPEPWFRLSLDLADATRLSFL